MIARQTSIKADDAREKDGRIAQVKRAAADYALAREPEGRRNAVIANLRALWELAASAGAPVEGLTVINKVIQAIEELNSGGAPALFHTDGSAAAAEKKAPATSSPDVALAAALVDALNQYERMPIQEAIDYVATKRGLAAAMLKTARQRLRSKTSKDPGQAHYQMALSTIAAQSDPMRAVRAQLAK
ncbi:MAG TPA: hypothetical protein VHA35_15325 [Dongiaceae bacterium]|jgi:hypothetical protein|nr:hypothetical protein [Dongiaceae bacterium]